MLMSDRGLGHAALDGKRLHCSQHAQGSACIGCRRSRRGSRRRSAPSRPTAPRRSRAAVDQPPRGRRLRRRFPLTARRLPGQPDRPLDPPGLERAETVEKGRGRIRDPPHRSAPDLKPPRPVWPGGSCPCARRRPSARARSSSHHLYPQRSASTPKASSASPALTGQSRTASSASATAPFSPKPACEASRQTLKVIRAVTRA